MGEDNKSLVQYLFPETFNALVERMTQAGWSLSIGRQKVTGRILWYSFKREGWLHDPECVRFFDGKWTTQRAIRLHAYNTVGSRSKRIAKEVSEIFKDFGASSRNGIIYLPTKNDK